MPETQADRLIQQVADHAAAHGAGKRTETLVAALHALAASYEQLQASLHERRTAIRHADLEHLKAATASETAVVGRIGELNHDREHAVRELARDLRIRVDDHESIPIGVLLNRLDGEEHDEVEHAASRLRDRISRVRDESVVIRDVGESLLSHVRSLAQRLQLAISHVAVYSRDGRVGNSGTSALVRGVDLRT